MEQEPTIATETELPKLADLVIPVEIIYPKDGDPHAPKAHHSLIGVHSNFSS